MDFSVHVAMLSNFKFSAVNLALKGLRKALCLLVRCGVQPITGTKRMARVSSSGVATHYTRHRGFGIKYVWKWGHVCGCVGRKVRGQPLVVLLLRFHLPRYFFLNCVFFLLLCV